MGEDVAAAVEGGGREEDDTCCWVRVHVVDPLVDATGDAGAWRMYGRPSFVWTGEDSAEACDPEATRGDGSACGDGACDRCCFSGR